MTQVQPDWLGVSLKGLADGNQHGDPGGEPGHVDAAQAWRRGMRWGRRRRVVAATSMALCVGVCGALAWALPNTAPALQEAVVADRVFGPPVIPGDLWNTPPRAAQVAWGFPAVAVQEAPRADWFSSDRGVAVRTGDGRQGFIEAPEYAGEVTLSPDGRRLAYWVTGETDQTPNTGGGQVLPVVGMTVRDLVDGSLKSYRYPEAPHGVATGTLYWADDTLLVASAGAYRAGDDGDEMARSSSKPAHALLWDVEQRDPELWEDRFGAGAEVPEGAFSWAEGGVVTTFGPAEEIAGSETHPINAFGLRFGTASRIGTVRGTQVGGSAGLPPLIAGDAGSVFVVGDLRRAVNPNKVTELPVDTESEPGEPRVLNDSDGTFGFFGRREGTLLVAAVDPTTQTRTAESAQDVVAMNVQGDDRAHEVLVDVHAEQDSDHGRWQWATAVLETAPVVDGTEPQAPVSPWLVIGTGVGLLLLGLGAAGVWWRRAQP